MLEMATTLAAENGKFTAESIRNDKILFFGLSKMAEIIGEASYKITKEFKATHPEIPWRQIEGMRHILVHGYYSISPELLCDVIGNDIPALIPDLKKCIDELQ